MKILIVCVSMVFHERMFCELGKYAEVDVLTNYNPTCDMSNVNRLFVVPQIKKLTSWNRRFQRWFGVLLHAKVWTRLAIKEIAKQNPDGKYDMVLALTGSEDMTPMGCGLILSQKYKCKYGIYTVDALPPPGGWTKAKEIRGKTKIVVNHLSKADYISAANSHMLAYEMSLCTTKPNVVTNVLLTSSPQESYSLPISSENVLLYTGNLYGLRNPDYMLKAFKRVLQDRPDALLILCGARHIVKNMTTILTEEECQHVIKMPHQTDLAEIFARAKVLIDIDADLNKDPFLSSKIASYIKVNRMIVCETGRITPSRDMFAGYKTIIQCDHNEDSLYDGFTRALALADTEQDYSERNELIEMFDIKNIGKRLYKDLQEVCNDKQHI